MSNKNTQAAFNQLSKEIKLSTEEMYIILDVIQDKHDYLEEFKDDWDVLTEKLKTLKNIEQKLEKLLFNFQQENQSSDPF